MARQQANNSWFRSAFELKEGCNGLLNAFPSLIYPHSGVFSQVVACIYFLMHVSTISLLTMKLSFSDWSALILLHHLYRYGNMIPLEKRNWEGLVFRSGSSKARSDESAGAGAAFEDEAS